MNDALTACLLFVAVPATGSALLQLAGWRAPSLPLHFGMAVATGFACAITALYLPLAVTGTVWFVPALLVLAIGTLMRAFWWLRGWRTTLANVRHPFWVGLAMVGFVLVFCATTAPYWGYDAKAIYGIKAKALLHDGNLDGPIFQDPEVVHYHGDYPLGLPLLIAMAGYAAEGLPEDPDGIEPAPSVAHWLARHHSVRAYASLACLWTLAILGFVVHFARRASSGRAAVLLLGSIALPVVLVFPWIGGRSFSMEGADVPLTLLLGATGWMFLEHLRTRSRATLALAMLLAASALWIKNDGLIALGTLFAAVFLCDGLGRNLRAVATVGIAMAVASGIAAGLAATTAGAPYDEHYVSSLAQIELATILDRVPLLIRSVHHVLEKRFVLEYWAFVLLIAAPFGIARGGMPRIVALWLLGHVAAMTAIFLVTPNSVTWHVTTALPRLWGQVALPAAGLLILCVGEAWRQLATPVPAKSEAIDAA